jgi:hypothetical protein
VTEDPKIIMPGGGMGWLAALAAMQQHMVPTFNAFAAPPRPRPWPIAKPAKKPNEARKKRQKAQRQARRRNRQ